MQGGLLGGATRKCKRGSALPAGTVPKIGAFFDDPTVVPGEETRCSVGVVYKTGAELATPQGELSVALCSV